MDNRANFECLPLSQLQKKSNDIYVYFGSQEELNVGGGGGGNVNFGLQKYMYTKLFNIVGYYIKMTLRTIDNPLVSKW